MQNEKIPENTLSHDERNKLVEDNLALVWHFVHKICKDEALKEDCFQSGCIGLIRASRLYDASRNSKFSVFAAFEIQCSIRDFLFYNKDIRLPDTQRSGITAYYKKINSLNSEEVEITPSVLYDTAKEFGLTPEVSERLANPSVSMQSTLGGKDDSEAAYVEDMIASNSNPEDCLEPMYLKDLIDTIMDTQISLLSNKNPEQDEMLVEYLKEFIKKSIGFENYLSMQDIIRKHYPEFVIYEDDSEEVKKNKRKLLDNKYCSFSAKWVKQKKQIASILKSYVGTIV